MIVYPVPKHHSPPLYALIVSPERPHTRLAETLFFLDRTQSYFAVNQLKDDVPILSTRTRLGWLRIDSGDLQGMP